MILGRGGQTAKVTVAHRNKQAPVQINASDLRLFNMFLGPRHTSTTRRKRGFDVERRYARPPITARRRVGDASFDLSPASVARNLEHVLNSFLCIFPRTGRPARCAAIAPSRRSAEAESTCSCHLDTHGRWLLVAPARAGGSISGTMSLSTIVAALLLACAPPRLASAVEVVRSQPLPSNRCMASTAATCGRSVRLIRW